MLNSFSWNMHSGESQWSQVFSLPHFLCLNLKQCGLSCNPEGLVRLPSASVNFRWGDGDGVLLLSRNLFFFWAILSLGRLTFGCPWITFTFLPLYLFTFLPLYRFNLFTSLPLYLFTSLIFFWNLFDLFLTLFLNLFSTFFFLPFLPFFNLLLPFYLFKPSFNLLFSFLKIVNFFSFFPFLNHFLTFLPLFFKNLVAASMESHG